MEQGKGHITIALVDNDAMALMALRSLLAREGFTVLWTAQLGAAAIQRCIRAQDRPDVLLVDMALTDMTGVDVCRAVRRWAPELPMLGMTAYDPAVYRDAACESGAADVISKDDIAAITRMIRRLAAQCAVGLSAAGLPVGAQPMGARSHGTCAAPCAVASQRTAMGLPNSAAPITTPTARTAQTAGMESRTNVESDSQPTRSFALSAQQAAIMRRYADGRSTEEIAAELGISKGTIFSQVARVREKLHARDRDEAVALCRRYLRM
ncbi:response regulator transcription factor [Bifidobacterium miconisargentati]|uniref:response regulator transcription factor n=1 Tax=Bifidobacterium miconisargentati TaxID=2834437 RepID=UPI001BDBF959|nr:response regulator transcription factor [Bifidobacterium miconisargentati]MBW3089640.1 response regulator transcription factor [Bifidobacterium miconisargentati]